MTGSVSVLGLMLAILVPWLLGGVSVYAMTAPAGRWRLWLSLGHGYFLGLFAMAGLLMLSNALGLPLHFGWLLGVLLALCLPAVLILRRKASGGLPSVEPSPGG